MKMRSLLATALFTLAACAMAADKEVEDLLTKMRDAYKGVKTAHISAKSKTPTQDGTSREATLEGFVKNGKFHMKLTGHPGAEEGKTVTVIADGTKIWGKGFAGGDFDADFSVDNMQQAVTGFNLEVLNFWDYARQLSTGEGGNMATSALTLSKETWNGKEWTVLNEVAEAQGVSVKYYIDPKTNLMWRTVMKTSDGSTELGEFEITKLDLDKEVGDDLFKG